MENTKKLRIELTELYEKLKRNEIDISKAKAMIAATNVMVKSASLELDYKKVMGDKDKTIPFLETND